MSIIKGILKVCKGIYSDNVLTFEDSQVTPAVSLQDLIGGGLGAKAGTVSGASFVAGSNRYYDVVFSTAFADTNYSITLGYEDQRKFTYSNKATTGFRINSNASSSLAGDVDWVATEHGES